MSDLRAWSRAGLTPRPSRHAYRRQIARAWEQIQARVARDVRREQRDFGRCAKVAITILRRPVV